MSRRAKIDISTNSWGKWRICTCCAIEFEFQRDRGGASRCKTYLLKELNPPRVRPKIKSKRTPISKIWINYNN